MTRASSNVAFFQLSFFLLFIGSFVSVKGQSCSSWTKRSSCTNNGCQWISQTSKCQDKPSPTPAPVAPTCFGDLGDGVSKAIGYNGVFPKTSSTGLKRRGTDDAIAFLVGGNYVAPNAAEIEGKVVVLGDFLIGSKGTNSIGTWLICCFARARSTTVNLLST